MSTVGQNEVEFPIYVVQIADNDVLIYNVARAKSTMRYRHFR